MPRIVGPGHSRLLISAVVLVLVFAFTPISTTLLKAVHGSFSPERFSSLALKTPSDAAVGLLSGQRVRVVLTNHTGHRETYHWNATQKGGLISLGEETVGNGSSTTIAVPTRGAATGALKVSLAGTNVFVTVPVLGS
jgi:hypothetical protein